MSKINQRILRKIIKFQLDLIRLENRQKRQAINILNDVEKRIVSTLSEGELLQFSRNKINSVISSLHDPIKTAYETIKNETQDTLDGLVEIQIKAAYDSLASVVINTSVALPAAGVIAQLNKPLMQGALFSDWVSKQSADTIFKVSGAIREGVFLGETNQDIIRRIAGTKTTPGLIEISRKSAASLVQTATHQVGNNARQAVYEANDDVVTATAWLATLDSHTCPRCIARSGLIWKNNSDHTPIGHSVPYQIPPIHFNDRCILTPIVDSEYLPKGLPVGERASSLGPVKADITFKEYLDLVDENQVEDMLGKGRAEMFKSGQITLRQLIDQQGNELSLAELKSLYN